MKEKKVIFYLIFLLVFVSIPALFSGVMEPDSALYASISKNIVQNNDWLNLYVRGADWLDKPHLTFWLAAASFKLFGISAFAYKLPSFLAGLLAAWYTYKLAHYIYNEKIAVISSLIFLSSLHVTISTFDVRAEIYIAAFSIASIYHYVKAHNKSLWHIVVGSFFAACAVLVKGIFVLITIFSGFVIYWLLTGQPKQLLKAKWWFAVLLILLFVTPEIYALYMQFDAHPEKVIFGNANVSGVKFFFWDSQFGRFFNTGPIKGRGDITFFLHTTIWAFLPWGFLFYAAVGNLFRKENRFVLSNKSIIVWSGALITFILFSLSSFQLPHYIILILPQFAIITSVYLNGLQVKGTKVFYHIQSILYILVCFALATVAIFYNFEGKYLSILILALVLCLGLQFFKAIDLQSIIGRSAFTAVAISLFLSVFFYPAILKYQAGMRAANWLNENKPNSKAAVYNYADSFSFDFYTNGNVKYYWNFNDLKTANVYGYAFLIPEKELKKVKLALDVVVLKEFEYYHISKLTPQFLNSKTRSEVLEKLYLVKIQ